MCMWAYMQWWGGVGGSVPTRAHIVKLTKAKGEGEGWRPSSRLSRLRSGLVGRGGVRFVRLCPAPALKKATSTSARRSMQKRSKNSQKCIKLDNFRKWRRRPLCTPVPPLCPPPLPGDVSVFYTIWYVQERTVLSFFERKSGGLYKGQTRGGVVFIKKERGGW